MVRTSLIVLFLLTLPAYTLGQESRINLVLLLNTESADRAVALYEGLSGSPQEIAQLRGSQLALATTALLAQQELSTPDLERNLAAAKYNQTIDNDIFRMKEARGSLGAIKDLLVEIRQRNFAQKVTSTVEQLFPSDTQLSTTIPIFFVAFGHANIDAYVRRVVWRGNAPLFVGEGQGELTIVVNLAKAISYGRTTDERFIGMMSIVAHEVFHAAFGAYKDRSPFWRQYYGTRRSYLEQLLDLAQNEGIAYYLTLVQRSRGKLQYDEIERVNGAFAEFNRNAAELLSNRLTDYRANEILRLSNTSGYWQSFGAITGMIVARQIDQILGREALVETVALGPKVFFEKYSELMKRNNDIPLLSDDVLRFLSRTR
jgi:hypothetical protein